MGLPRSYSLLVSIISNSLLAAVRMNYRSPQISCLHKPLRLGVSTSSRQSSDVVVAPTAAAEALHE
jgi:hypothetical protein